MTRSNSARWSRRDAGAGLAGLAVALLAGCGGGRSDAAPARRPAMTVYRNPGCGCCLAWADIARRAGFPVNVVARSDMTALKARLGVPAALASCHTSLVGGFVVEGHVPLEAVAKLLAARPRGTRGIAVAGMPRGAPGMEMPDGSADRFDVMAFDPAGKIRKFGA